jgi:hypothetical protein
VNPLRRPDTNPMDAYPTEETTMTLFVPEQLRRPAITRNSDLEIVCLWAAAGLALFALVSALGFGDEIGQAMGLG